MAQSTAPTTVPAATTGATAPATPPASQPTSPRAAYRALILAMDAGDAGAIVALLYVQTDLQRELGDAVAAFAAALANLRRIASEAYGPGNTRILMGDAEALAEALARVDAATERIDGDSATLVDPDDGKTLAALRRDGGQWKVALAGALRDLSAADARATIDEMRLHIRLFGELGSEIVEHRYQTADEAAQVLRARLMRPATEPTGAPAEP